MEKEFSLARFDTREINQLIQAHLQLNAGILNLLAVSSLSLGELFLVSRISLKPRIDVSGVRSSCDIRARNRER